MTLQKRTLGIGIAVALLAGVGSADAVLYDRNITPDVIMGSGIDNGAWTVDRANNIELGLRAKLRFDGTNSPQNIFNSAGNGDYYFDPIAPPTGFGFAPGSSSTAIWNFEWSVNSGLSATGDPASRAVNGLRYEIGIDFDPSAATQYLTFDPINTPWADHSFGYNDTGNGSGSSAPFGDTAEYASLINTRNVAQNSWNMEFFDDGDSGFTFTNTDPGIYSFYLTAFDGDNESVVASTSMRIITTPEPGSLGLLGLGLLGFGLIRRRRSA